MKYKALILIGFLMLVLLPSSWAQLTKKVLFIGNSYTARNALVETVKQLALSVGDTLIYDVHSPGGQRFLNHAANPIVYDKMRSEDWDYVILQGQSQEPSWSDAQVNTQVRPYVNQLVDSIYATSSCAIPMFYMTWGRKNGDALNCTSWPPVCTYEGMDSILRKNYLDFAVSRDGEAAPVGAVWRQIRKDHPSIELYAADESHPSIAGTYAAAAAFYASIFHKDPTACTFTTVDTATAGKIKRTARDVVLDSLFLWNIREYEPYDSIAHTIQVTQNGVEIKLSVPSLRGAVYNWLKDDVDPKTTSYQNPGVSYSLEDPVGHRFTVEIIHCDSIIYDTLTVYWFQGVENLESSIKIYPNPTPDFINIDELKWETATIYNLEGQLLFKREDYTKIIDVRTLEPGVYCLFLRKAERVHYARFIKLK